MPLPGNARPLETLCRTGGPAELRQLIARWARSGADNGVATAVRKAFGSSTLRTWIWGVPRPRAPGNLMPKVGVRLSSLPQVAQYYSWTLSPARDELAAFLALKQRYDRSVLLGAHAEAEAALLEVERRFGLSQWLLQASIAHLQRTRGVEYQKRYAKTLLSHGLAPQPAFFLQCWSARSEPQVSAEQWLGLVATWIELVPKEMFSFVVWKLARFYVMEGRFNVLSVFSEETASPVVDQLLAVLRLSQHLVCRDPDAAREVLAPLAGVFAGLGTIETHNIACALGANSTLHQAPADMADWAALIGPGTSHQGKISAIGRMLDSGSERLVELAMAAATLGAVEEVRSRYPGSPLAAIASAYRSMFHYDDDSLEATESLHRLLLEHQDADWASTLFCAVRDHQSVSANLPKPLERLRALTSQAFDIEAATVLGRIGGADYGARTLEVYAKHLAKHELDWVVGVANAVPGTDPRTILGAAPTAPLELRIPVLVRCGAWEQVVKELANTPAPQLLFVLLDALIQTEQFESAMELAADLLIRFPWSFRRVPLDQLVVQLEEHPTAERSGNICWPILLDHHFRHVSPKRDPQRCEAVEDLLLRYGVERPSSLLLPPEGTRSRERVVYFLRNVCVPNVLDWMTEFDGTEALLSERIQICQRLKACDAKNTPSYDAEIKHITRYIATTRGVSAVERSKVFVNTDGLRIELSKVARERYERFLSLRSLEGATGQVGSVMAALNRLSETADGKPRDGEIESESEQVFSDLVMLVRDRFVSSTEYGLNGVLSGGIRHGTLVGQLQAPLSASGLLRRRAQDDAAPVAAAYTGFLDEHADLVRVVVKEWVQVSTVADPGPAIFGYHLATSDVAALRGRTDGCPTFESFIDEVLAFLWERTERQLDVGRARIAGHLKELFVRVFDVLSTTMDASQLQLPGLRADVTAARTATQVAIDRIASWFRRPEFDGVPERCLIQLPIDVASQQVANIYPGFRINVRTQVDRDVELGGALLRPLSDIFFWMLDNAVQHGGFDENISVDIVVTADVDALVIGVTNPLGPGVDRHVAGAIAIDVSDRLRRGDYLAGVAREGNSGFDKIMKLSCIELACPRAALQADVEGDSFKVMLRLPGLAVAAPAPAVEAAAEDGA